LTPFFRDSEKQTGIRETPDPVFASIAIVDYLTYGKFFTSRAARNGFLPIVSILFQIMELTPNFNDSRHNPSREGWGGDVGAGLSGVAIHDNGLVRG
jgi:hypothetical protein